MFSSKIPMFDSLNVQEWCLWLYFPNFIYALKKLYDKIKGETYETKFLNPTKKLEWNICRHGKKNIMNGKKGVKKDW